MLATRSFGNLIRAAGATRLKHTLPELPYEYSALEPVISREIMSLHHSKHHATYVNNLNVAEEKLVQAQSKAAETSTLLSLLSAVKFNGGGHVNHSILWCNLSPCKTEPSCTFLKAVTQDFGSLENMKNQLAAASVGVQGSGWGWLGYNKQMKKLQIATCQNQDPLQATTGLIPLFGIDVWEHAYYLQYKNVRADYVKAIFDVANWQDISARYDSAAK
ncbi:PREDICTED: superoxide dismutase [Mn], mitochondrial isoform X1 [Papilio polytes]|uniref:superoxide dismutase [Mn], mitochondrial isoform X1 n=1 Tax=Papilio polytes TaxID=76194 RepID=UPI000675E26D|nr:PREDICTED: superoxide dismutase [Mn], mitochondrial isoform X1 [Papilio polytes]